MALALLREVITRPPTAVMFATALVLLLLELFLLLRLRRRGPRPPDGDATALVLACVAPLLVVFQMAGAFSFPWVPEALALTVGEVAKAASIRADALEGVMLQRWVAGVALVAMGSAGALVARSTRFPSRVPSLLGAGINLAAISFGVGQLLTISIAWSGGIGPPADRFAAMAENMQRTWPAADVVLLVSLVLPFAACVAAAVYASSGRQPGRAGVLSGAAAAGLALLSLGAACMLVTRETRKEVRALEAASEALRKAEAEPEGPEMRARRARFFAETPIAVCRGRLEQARDAVAVTWPAFAAAQLASREHPMFRTVTMELWGDTESGADFSVSAEISERLGDEVKDWAPYRYRKGERRVRYRPERARVVALYPRWEGEITVNGPVAPEQSELVVGVFELAIDDCAKQLLTLPSPFEPPRR